MLPPVDSIHDLQRPAGTWLFAERSQKAHELFGFFGYAEAQEGVHRECRISDPGVAVIPVALAANALRQAARGSRDNRAGRLVGQQLQREGGTVHHFSPAAGISGLADPSLPKFNGSAEQILGFLSRRGNSTSELLRQMTEHENSGLPLAQGELRDDGAVDLLKGLLGGETKTQRSGNQRSPVGADCGSVRFPGVVERRPAFHAESKDASN